MKEKMYLKGHEVENYHWWGRGKQEIVLGLAGKELAGLRGQGKLIDFGCGPGGGLAKVLSEYGTVTGLDFSNLAIALAKEDFDGDFRQADLSEPIEPWDSYDVGFCLDVLEHIETDLVAATNIFNFLRPGGTCIITVPAYQWLWAPMDDNCMHKRRYNKKQLERLLFQAGFQIEYLGYYMTILFLPAASVRLLSKFSNKESASIEGNFGDTYLNQILFNIFHAEKGWICKGHTFPFGLSLIAKVKRPNG